MAPERIWTEYHPLLGWFHQKNKQALQHLTHGDIEVYINSDGFRGAREYQREKPQAVRRLVALGDSFTFGFGVRDDESFPYLMEKSNENLEVINLGVAGFGIDQMLIAFRNIAREYNPDTVLVSIFPEDFWRATRAFADSGHAKPYFSLESNGELKLHNVPVPKPYELRTNQFPKLIEYNRFEALLRNLITYRLLERGLLRLGKGLGWVDPDTTIEWRIGRAVLEKLIQEIRDSGAEAVLVMIPPDRWIRDYRMTAMRESIVRFAKRKNLHYIDLTPEFYRNVQEKGLTHYYIEGDWHWTKAGHELASNLIAKYLDHQGLGSFKSPGS